MVTKSVNKKACKIIENVQLYRLLYIFLHYTNIHNYSVGNLLDILIFEKSSLTMFN